MWQRVGGVYGKWGHAWQRGTCLAAGMHGGDRGHAWHGGVCGRGMHGRGRVSQERRPLQRTVRILLECILVNLVARIHLFPKTSPGKEAFTHASSVGVRITS